MLNANDMQANRHSPHEGIVFRRRNIFEIDFGHVLRSIKGVALAVRNRLGRMIFRRKRGSVQTQHSSAVVRVEGGTKSAIEAMEIDAAIKKSTGATTGATIADGEANLSTVDDLASGAEYLEQAAVIDTPEPTPTSTNNSPVNLDRSVDFSTEPPKKAKVITNIVHKSEPSTHSGATSAGTPVHLEDKPVPALQSTSNPSPTEAPRVAQQESYALTYLPENDTGMKANNERLFVTALHTIRRGLEADDLILQPSTIRIGENEMNTKSLTRWPSTSLTVAALAVCTFAVIVVNRKRFTFSAPVRRNKEIPDATAVCPMPHSDYAQIAAQPKDDTRFKDNPPISKECARPSLEALLSANNPSKATDTQDQEPAVIETHPTAAGDNDTDRPFALSADELGTERQPISKQAPLCPEHTEMVDLSSLPQLDTLPVESAQFLQAKSRKPEGGSIVNRIKSSGFVSVSEDESIGLWSDTSSDCGSI